MKKLVLLLVAALMWLPHVGAQDIAVTKFEAAPTDLTANLEGTMVLDQNGNACALIRIQTTQKGFSFDVGSLGVQKVDYDHVGEVWVYVPAGVRHIDIRHSQLGSLLNYEFPVSIEQARTYYMELKTATVTTIVQEDDGMTYFTMEVKPVSAAASAMVTVDGNLCQLDSKDGTMMLRMKRGSHTYSVQAPGYESKSGKFDLGVEKIIEKVQLVSLMASLSVSCGTSGVDIYINGERKGTGPWTGELLAGSYTVEARRDRYYSQSRTVTLGEREQRTLELPALSARMGQLSVNASPYTAKVMVDGKEISSGSSSLQIGSHKVNVSQQGYQPEERTVVIEEGKTTYLSVSLSAEANFTITTSPSRASIYLDGDYLGSSPCNKELVSGNYRVKAVKRGYKEYDKKLYFDCTNPEVYIHLKQCLNSKSEIYLEGGCGVGGMFSYGGGLGAYIKNINIEANYYLSSDKSEVIYWNGNDNKKKCFTYSPSFNASFKVGYGIPVGSRIRITPQVGAAMVKLKEKLYYSTTAGDLSPADGAYVFDGVAALRLSVGIKKFLGVSLTPEYRFAVVESDGYKALSDVSPKIKDWGEGFNVKLALVIFFGL